MARSETTIDVAFNPGTLADALDVVSRHAAACAAELRELLGPKLGAEPAPRGFVEPGREQGSTNV